MTPDRQDKHDLRLAPPQDGEAFRIVEDAPRRRFGPRAILFAGVAGACVLGVGLGLWARPGMAERRVAVVAPEPPASPDPAVAQTMKIVVNDGPAAQVGAPIETLRPAPKPLFATLRPQQDGQAVMGQVPELTRLQPKPLPALQIPHIKAPHLETPHLETPKLPDLAPLLVAAVAAPGHWLEKLKPAPRPVETAAATPPPSHAKAAAEAARRAQMAQAAEQEAKRAQAQAAEDAAREASEQAAERAEARRVALAEAAARKDEARQAQLADARAEQARLVRAKLVQAQTRVEKARLQQLKLEQAKAQVKADKAEKLRLARAEQAEARKLALAEAKGRAEARAEAKAMVLAQARDEAKKRERLEALVHAVQKVLPNARFSVNTETARQDRKHPAPTRSQHGRDPQVERASLKARKAPRVTEPLSRSRPVQVAPVAPSGLVKVSTPRCALHDPGAALVCADPSLSAADRQMSRAYQGARAAGVPEAQLAAQQQRWLAARSAAAREAPWAMRDVYLARIAELNSQARDAHGDGY